ncbi:hypothetical protein GCM10018793_46920 [Streptomyces sulfonofaciens]|uniref:Uncharacterized protein n=1 Tax=Streptomyces sulfonofaciens TaxID=68272 RepID=A0A919L3Q9_9ACTN|nr:hypothetical protein [Streptomyces sulfonofaciens]GHH83845.1 hypothetical protein GCM10018793_46920 [Streptomyces sulfonofaciens]
MSAKKLQDVLDHQSHHMVNLWVSGPDALKLFTGTGINSTAKFPVDSTKQFVPVSPEGGVIGDGIVPARRGGVRLRRTRSRRQLADVHGRTRLRRRHPVRRRASWILAPIRWSGRRV